MRSIIIFLLFPVTVFGNTNLKNFFKSSYADQICQQTMRAQGSYTHTYLKFVAGNSEFTFFVYNKKKNYEVKVIELDSGIESSINLEKQVVDIKVVGNEIFVLASDRLNIYNDNLKLVETTRTLPNHLNYKKNGFATGLAVKDSSIFISHGNYGFTHYDRKSSNISEIFNPAIPQPLSGHRSSIDGIAVNENFLYLSYDDITLHQNTKAFEGILIWDLKLKKTHKIIPVNQRKEAYYKPSLTIDRDELVVSNLHLNFRHKINKLESDKYMEPLLRVWKYPAGSLIGKGFILNGEIYGCFHDEYSGLISANYSSIQ